MYSYVPRAENVGEFFLKGARDFPFVGQNFWSNPQVLVIKVI